MPELFPFQRKGVLFLNRRKGRALIADPMGLGKTVQALGWLNHRKSARPVVVICPSSVRLNWQREIDRWLLGEEAYLPRSQRADGLGYDEQTFIVIHYDIVQYWVEWLKKLKPMVLIVDEAQAIKSNGAKRTKAVKKLAKGIRHVIGLTGTPIVNRPIEVFNILYIIDKTAIPNFHTFTRRYCAAKFNGFGWDYSGASNTKELHNLLTSSIVLRRRKEDVLTSLPPKIRSFVPLSLDNQAEYEAAEEDLISYLLETEGKAAANRAKSSPALVRISKLRMLAARGKLEQAIDWISDTIVNHKLVVFGVHREIIDPVSEHFKKVAVKIAGDVSETDRQKAIDKFQTDPKIRLFVGQVQAAGVGITLTASSHVAFLELPWTPGDVLQAEDRVHRIGQEQPCVIYYLMAARTIDEDMAKLIDKKRSILNAVLDGSHDASPTILTELLATYKKRRGKHGLNRSLNPEEVSNQIRLQDRHGNGVSARRGT
jgi:SWI/SNF-related matrix-associated actin-dependent regulator of chromatin subfamily A-like protein 1